MNITPDEVQPMLVQQVNRLIELFLENVEEFIDEHSAEYWEHGADQIAGWRDAVHNICKDKDAGTAVHDHNAALITAFSNMPQLLVDHWHCREFDGNREFLTEYSAEHRPDLAAVVAIVNTRSPEVEAMDAEMRNNIYVPSDESLADLEREYQEALLQGETENNNNDDDD